jgi:hypothetical protein
MTRSGTCLAQRDRMYRSALLLLVACGDSTTPVPLIDAAIDAEPDAAPSLNCPDPPVDPTAAGDFIVFVATEGVTLTTGCGDHSAPNCTTLLQQGATIPAVFPSEPTRDAAIAEILALVRSRLVPYSVDLVTTRPSTGNYNMIVFGGDSDAVGLPNSPVGVAPFNCMSTPDDHVALLFDLGLTDVTTTFYANQMLFQIGSFEGLTLTRTADDCECAIDPECEANTGALCSFTSGPTSTMFPNCGRAIQDSLLLLKEAFGCR